MMRIFPEDWLEQKLRQLARLTARNAKRTITLAKELTEIFMEEFSKELVRASREKEKKGK